MDLRPSARPSEASRGAWERKKEEGGETGVGGGGVARAVCVGGLGDGERSEVEESARTRVWSRVW